MDVLGNGMGKAVLHELESDRGESSSTSRLKLENKASLFFSELSAPGSARSVMTISADDIEREFGEKPAPSTLSRAKSALKLIGGSRRYLDISNSSESSRPILGRQASSVFSGLSSENLSVAEEESPREEKQSVVSEIDRLGLHVPQTKLPWFIIHPQNKHKVRWDLFISVLIVYSLVVIPFRIMFSQDATGGWFVLEWIVDGFFLLDLILSFFTTFFSNDELEHRPLVIALSYLRTWFFIDLVSILPVELILSPYMNTEDAGLESLKLVKFFRLIRLIKIVRLLKLKKVGNNLEGAIRINPALWRLTKLLLNIVFIAHLQSCMWFYIATLDESDQNWVMSLGLQDAEVTTQYLSSLYWTVATMMAVGYGDIHAVNDVERVYSILVQVTGATSFGFIIANIAAFLETFDPRASAYKARIDRLKQYMRDRGLPRKLQKRVKRYYDYLLSKESIFDDSKILAQLPSHLTETIVLHVHGEKARQIEWLKNEDSSFVAYIMARSRVMMALSGEVICEQDSVGTNFYMILQGRAEAIILTEDVDDDEADGNNETAVKSGSLTSRSPLGKLGRLGTTMGLQGQSQSQAKNMDRIGQRHAVVCGLYTKGANFGEVGVIRSQPHSVTFRANRTCDLISISKDHMDYAIYMFPSSALRFRKRCDTHAELMEESVKAPYSYFPNTDRRIKSIVTLDGSAHASGSSVEQKIGRMILSTMIAHDGLGRFKSQAQRETTKKLLKHAPSDVTLLRSSVKVRRSTLQNGIPASNLQPVAVSKGKGKPKVTPMHNGRPMGPVRSPTSVNIIKKDGMEMEEVEMEEEEILKQLWVIPPGHPMKVRWEILLGALIVYSVVMVPFRVGFDQPAVGGWEVWDVLVDILFGIDIVLSFRSAFESSDGDILIVAPQLIAKNYLRGWFTIDFLSVFPLDRIVQATINFSNSDALQSIRLIRILRLARLLKLFRVFKLKKIFETVDTDIVEFVGAFKLITLFLQISFVAHLFACFFFFVASTSDDFNNIWYIKAGFSPESEQDVGSKYITSLYWSFTSMTTVGYGDVSPTTNEERLYSIFIMIMGATIFGYVVGSIASLIQSLDLSVALHKAKMSDLASFLSEQGVPRSIRKECTACYSYALSLKSVFDEQALLAALSPSLRHETLIFIHQAAVDSIPIFKGQTATFIADLLSIMNPQLALPNTFIVRAGEIGSLIFFIVNGNVTVYEGAWPEPDEYGQVLFEKPKLMQMSAGNFFGHESVLTGHRSEVTAKSVRMTQLYILSKAAIGNLVDATPPFALQLQAALRKAIRKQDISFGRLDPTPSRKKKQLWSVVQDRFGDILNLSPLHMKRLSGEATSSKKLEELISKLFTGKAGPWSPLSGTSSPTPGLLSVVGQLGSKQNANKGKTSGAVSVSIPAEPTVKRASVNLLQVNTKSSVEKFSIPLNLRESPSHKKEKPVSDLHLSNIENGEKESQNDEKEDVKQHQ